jgi:hypothetical protein
MDRHSENEYVQRVGKAAIVKSILDAEYTSLFKKNYPFTSQNMFSELDNTWYIKVFRMLGAEIKTKM